MNLEINCKICKKLIMLDPYERLLDPKRFYSGMCNKCDESRKVT